MTTITDDLAAFRRPAPDWLMEVGSVEAGRADQRRALLRRFLSERVVFYPGSGSDGQPVALFNQTHSAHCYVYVDYLLERDDLLRKLITDGFLGYRKQARVDLDGSDFGPVRYHAPPQNYRFEPVKPYGFVQVFEREAGLGESHGAARFAVLFLGADGHATYDALFCQENGVPAPWCMVLQDHGFGGNYSDFGAGGLTHQVARACGVYPDFMLRADNTRIWPGYEECLDAQGERLETAGFGAGYMGGRRSLWARTAARDMRSDRPTRGSDAQRSGAMADAGSGLAGGTTESAGGG